MEFIEKVLSQYGFGVAMALIMAWFFWKVLTYVMNLQTKLLTQSEARERELFNINKTQIEALTHHTTQSMEFHREMKTAFEFNRKEHEQQMGEHKQMTEALGRINGYKD